MFNQPEDQTHYWLADVLHKTAGQLKKDVDDETVMMINARVAGYLPVDRSDPKRPVYQCPVCWVRDEVKSDLYPIGHPPDGSVDPEDHLFRCRTCRCQYCKPGD